MYYIDQRCKSMMTKRKVSREVLKMFIDKTNSNYMAKFCFDLGIVSMTGCVVDLRYEPMN